MGDDSIDGPPAKKRAAARQISKDDGSESEGELPPHEKGSFRKASEEVLATRRIVKVRRCNPPQTGPSSNPFASIRLVPPPDAPLPPPSASVTSAASAVFAGTLKESQGETTDPSIADKAGGVKEGATNNLCAISESTDVDGKDEPNKQADKHQASALETDDSCVGKLIGESVNDGATDSERGQIVDESEVGVVEIKDNVVESQSETGSNIGQVVENQPAQSGGGSSVVSNSAAFGKDGLTASDAGLNKAALSPGTSADAAPMGFASFSSTWAFKTSSISETGSTTMFSFQSASDGTYSTPAPAFGNNSGSNFQLFNSNPSSLSSITAVAPSHPTVQLQQVPLLSGEEQEKSIFSANATLFEYADCSWKERGKGELKVNVPDDTSGKPRLLMRAKGNYKLLLNASLFPDMKLNSMDSRGVTFACANSEAGGKDRLTTYAVRLKDSLLASEFREAVDTLKGKVHAASLKTPENSPRAVRESGIEDTNEP